MRPCLPLLALLLATGCSASKGLHDLAASVDCALGCALANATGSCTESGCVIATCLTGFADCNGQPEDGCEVDLDADPKHCSLCGNVCDTGSCHQGSCQDLKVVASMAGDGRSVVDYAVDPNGVFFVLGNPPVQAWDPLPGTPPSTTVSVEFAARTGGDPVGLADTTGFTARLAAGDERLGLLVQDSARPSLVDPGTDQADAGVGPTVVAPYRLLSLPKVGGDPTLLASGDGPVSNLAVLGPSVYWLTGGLTAMRESGDGGGLANYQTDQVLSRAPITGGASETLGSWTRPDIVSLLGAGDGVLLVRKDILVESGDGALGLAAGGLYGIDPESRGQTPILETLCWACPTALDDGLFYWTDTSTSAVASVPVGGGVPTMLWKAAAATLWKSDATVSANEVAVTARFLFLTVGLYRTQDRSAVFGILRVDRSNGQEALLVKRDSALSHLAVDAEYVYWLELGLLVRTTQTGQL